MPGFIEPCDPTLHERAPVGSDWVYEIKTDGYRAQVHIRDKRMTVYSRSGYDWTDEFAPIVKAASQLKVREAIIDGEATVLGNTGLPDFQALRRELSVGERFWTIVSVRNHHVKETAKLLRILLRDSPGIEVVPLVESEVLLIYTDEKTKQQAIGLVNLITPLKAKP